MSVIIRNESTEYVHLTYGGVDVQLDPNKFIQVDSIDELMMDSMIVKIRRGVIKIKGLC